MKSDKLLESTMKSLQGKLVESLTKEEFNEVCNYIIDQNEQDVIEDVTSYNTYEEFEEAMEDFHSEWVENWVAYNIFNDDPQPKNPLSLRKRFYKFFWNKYKNLPKQKEPKQTEEELQAIKFIEECEQSNNFSEDQINTLKSCIEPNISLEYLKFIANPKFSSDLMDALIYVLTSNIRGERANLETLKQYMDTEKFNCEQLRQLAFACDKLNTQQMNILAKPQYTAKEMETIRSILMYNKVNSWDKEFLETTNIEDDLKNYIDKYIKIDN